MKREDESISRIQSVTGVSRETLGRLSIYADLLRRWQCRLNLVGPGTLDSLWERHFLDSAQLARYIPTGSKIVDIGTGAGFPGLVLSIMGVGQVELVERDQQKCTFLREVIRATGAEANVHCSEAKNLRLDSVQVVTARACAPLVRLLKISKYFIGPTTYCVFPKGETYEEELTAARKSWSMRVEAFESLTNPSSAILVIRDVVGKER